MSNINGKKVWAVMCGAIRNDFELFTIISMLCEYRLQGLIEGIVLSTWEDELENIEGLRDKLSKLNIYVVESESIDTSANNFVDIGFLRQTYQLKKGLSILPDDVFVLKCRTDLCIDEIRNFREVLEGKVDMSLGSWGAMDFGLNYRIAVNWLTCNTFFALRDVAFIGYKLDLLKMTTFSMTKLRNDRTIPPDFAFFISLFSEKYPIINEILDLIFIGDTFDAKIRGVCQKTDKENFMLPEMLNKLYALQYVLLYNCFYHAWGDHKDVEPEKIYLSDVLSANLEIGMGGGWLCRFINEAVLRGILHGKLVANEGYMRLYRHVNALTCCGYAEKMIINKTDYDEMYDWLNTFLKVDAKVWLRPWTKIIECVKDDKNDFTSAFSILADNTEGISKSLDYAIKYMVFSKKGGYYGKGVQIYENLEQQLGELNAGVLACVGRSEQTWIKRLIAKKAYGSNDEAYSKKVGFVFERWGNYPRLYALPFSAENISALYYYGSCQEKSGKDVIAKNLYTKLCGRFGVTPDAKVKEYTSKIYALIKSIIEKRYSEYETNIDVRNLVNFWADEMDIMELAEEVRKYLHKYFILRNFVTALQSGDNTAYDNLLLNIQNVTDKETILHILKMIYWYNSKQLGVTKAKADNYLADITERGTIDKDIYYITANIKNSFSKETFAEMLSLKQNYEDEEYQLICKLLADNGILTEVYDLLQKYANNPVKKVALSLFTNTQKYKKVSFMTVKNKVEYWLNYDFGDDYISKLECEYLKVSKNDLGISWPFADVKSPSPFALYIKPSAKGVYASIEFCAVPSLAKKYLFETISKRYNINEEDVISRIKTMDFEVNDSNSYEMAISKILDEFENIADVIKKSYLQMREKVNH